MAKHGANLERPPPTWGKFALAALVILVVSLLASTLLSAFDPKRPWPNSTTFVLWLCIASVIGYVAIGWHRLRVEISTRTDGQWPNPERVKAILMGSKLLLCIWVAVTFAAAIALGSYIELLDGP
jgi:hypothetical protein